MKAIFTWLVLLIIGAHSLALEAREIRLSAPDDPAETFLHVGSSNYRVGKFVIVHTILGANSDYWIVEKYLASCNGSFIVGPIVSDLIQGEMPRSTAFSKFLRSDKAKAVSVYTIDIRNDGIQYASLRDIVPHLPAICAAAAPELRNHHIPVAEGGNTIFSVITGTGRRNGNKVSIWTSQDDYVETEETIPGSQALGDTPVRTFPRKTLTGKKSLYRYVVDCQRRSLAVSEYVKYADDGSVIESHSIQEADRISSTVVPNSVGEAQLDFICTAY